MNITENLESINDRPYDGPARNLPATTRLHPTMIARQLAWLRSKPEAEWTERQREWYRLHSGIAAVTVTTAWGAEFDGPRDATDVATAATAEAARVTAAVAEAVAAQKPVPVVLATASCTVTFERTGDDAVRVTTRLIGCGVFGQRRTLTLEQGRAEYRRLALAGYTRW